MSVRRRIQLLVAMCVVLMTVVGLFAASTIARRDAAVRQVQDVIEPGRDQLNRLGTALVDQQTGLHGYLLTRDPELLAFHGRGVADARQATSELDAVFADEDGLRLQLRRLEVAAAAWQERAAAPKLALAEEGRWDEAAALVSEGDGPQLFEETRRELRGLRAALQERSAELAGETTTARTQLTALVFGSLLAALLMAGMVAWLVGRWITRPLETIGDAVERVARGDLHHPIPATGPPDTAVLGRNVEDMRATTVGLLDRAEAARQALEQQGAAVVLLRDELRPSSADLPPGVSVAATIEPVEGALAGDWLDVIDRGDGHVFALVVDVAGHGPRAGMLALRAKHLLVTALRMRMQPGEALDWLNEYIGDTGERFLTCIVLDLELETGLCQWANAGHPPGMLLVPGRDPSGNAVRLLEPTGPLLGPLPANWRTERVLLPTSGVVLLYTDGLIEARTGTELFGMERLRDIVLRTGVRGPEATLTAVLGEARRFAGRFNDDVTVVAMARSQQREPVRAPAEASARPHTV